MTIKENYHINENCLQDASALFPLTSRNLSRLLWVVDHDLNHNFQLWEQRLAPLNVTRVTELEKALELAASTAIDCIWIQGSSSYAVAETMAAIQRVNSAVPAVVCSPDLTSAGAARLTKLGAYHCFSDADDPQDVVSALMSAIDESNGRSRSMSQSHSEEPWRKFLICDSRPMHQIAR